MKLSDLAVRLGCTLVGEVDLEVSRVAGLEDARPGDVSFLANRKYVHHVATTNATAVIVAEGLATAPCALLKCRDPYLTFANAVALLAPPDRPTSGVSPLASVAPDAALGPDVSIGAFAIVGSGAVIGARTVLHPHAVVYAGARIGDDCVVHAHASIRERCELGSRVIVQNGAVIGGDGFGYAPRPDGSYQKIPQVANVVLEDDVEVGANATIDRPAVGETRIQSGTKIDNLVQIAHGVRVGRNVMLVAQVGIAGSTTVGDSVVLAGQVGVAGHLHIGDGARATAQSGIPNSVPAGALVSGYPAIDNREWLKASAVFRKLPELRKAIHDMSERMAVLDEMVSAQV